VAALLGEDHDLVVLKAKLDAYHHSGLLTDQAAHDVFNNGIMRQRQKLQAKGFKLAKRLYHRSPGKFVAVMQADGAANG
jgi:hypothetical protein